MNITSKQWQWYIKNTLQPFIHNSIKCEKCRSETKQADSTHFCFLLVFFLCFMLLFWKTMASLHANGRKPEWKREFGQTQIVDMCEKTGFVLNVIVSILTWSQNWWLAALNVCHVHHLSLMFQYVNMALEVMVNY